jgi:anti-sigma regulatory factor (Ser/Thr protein kinase)
MAEARFPTILLADEDQAFRRALADVFGQCGWQIEECSSAAAALDVLASHPCNLAVAAFPCEWVRRARAVQPGCKVVMTAAEPRDAFTVACAVREHAFSFFTMPFSPGVLADMAALALDGEPWEDDIELASGTPGWFEFTIRCKIAAAERVVQFLRELHADLGPQRRDDVAAALRELVMNAVEHGCGCDPAKRIRVCCVRTSRAVVCRVQDPGSGFSFDALPHAAVSNPPGEPIRHAGVREECGVRPGGFGILLSRSLADELVYNETGNEVLFIKYLNGG